jgi:hypothetical protein
MSHTAANRSLCFWIASQWAPAFEQRDLGSMQAAIIVCLAWFCIVFAVNSSIHSYLIVK